MTHIALFLPDLKGGGAERVVLMLAKYFVGQNHQVDLVLARGEGELLPLVPSMVRLVDLRVRMFFGWKQLSLALLATVQLVKYFRYEKPDVLLSTLTGANLAAVLARMLTIGHNPKLVLREAVTLRNLRSMSRLYLMRWLYPKADALIVLTEVMREELIKDIGLMPKIIFCIPNPVDRDFIWSQATENLEHPWFSSENLPVILGIGRLSVQKDFATLIHAFAQVNFKCKARLVILGEGELREELESLVRELDLEKDVLLPGFVVNPYRWLSRARVLVLPSLWEGYPNVVLEALALGKSVVITNYDASVKILASQSDNITITPIADPDAMAGTIVDILNAPCKNHDPKLPIGIESAPQRYLDLLNAVNSNFQEST
ncbi:MAG: glycosyltransferase [Candidatus Competibacter sp.]